MCCTRPPHVPVATIFEISRYMCIRNALLIRLLKIPRQHTTGFALLGAHQVGAVPEFPSVLCSTCSSSLAKPNLFANECLRIRNALLIRLLKILRHPTTGFALPLRAHQVGTVPQFHQRRLLLQHKTVLDWRVTLQLEHEAAWCSTLNCLEASQTRDSAGFQMSLSQNQIDLQMSVFLEISPIWVQIEHKVDGNSETAPT
ncbi:hypothetical protein CSKR_111684 [Clonorchis sinensis]|uniref:Uncharacterized protein n=1 Tax=Clonorchis sinensis TaxID=79923 RepID=A0A419PEX6_CLOSI|nr:hypothetical protein CSKR_111684 [Clonorchis sinensis]